MSLGLVFVAQDGLLLFADGRTSSSSASTWLSADTTKIVTAPDGSALAVVAVGRAKFDGEPVADVLSGFLGMFTLSSDVPPPWDPEAVARYLRDAICELTLRSSAADSGIEALVVGFDSDGHPACWRFDDVAADGVPLDVQRLDIESWGWAGIPCTNAQAAVADRVEAACNSGDTDPYTLRGRHLQALVEEVPAKLSQAIEAEPHTFEEDRVGGVWTMVQLRPHEPPVSTKHAMGPYERPPSSNT